MRKISGFILSLCMSLSFIYAQEEIDQVDLSGILNSSFDLGFVEVVDGTLYGMHSFVGAGLETGLIKYDGENWTAEDFPCNTCLRDLKLSPTGELWAAADSEGIYKLTGNGWEQVVDHAAVKIAFKSDDVLKIVNTDGVFTYANGQITEGNNSGKPSFFALTGFEIDARGDLWVLKSGELYFYSDANGWSQRTESFNPVLIDYAPDGKLWVAENTGVLSYFDDSGYHYNQIKNVFPSGVKATALHIDDMNTFWVGVQGDTPGLTKYNETEEKHYTSESLVDTSNPITQAFVTSNGEVWAFENYNNIAGHIYENTSGFVDEDQDGFTNEVDCDDNNAAINPEAEEIPNNDIDENCDGETLIIDIDQDGFNSDEDCDDENASINPNAEEIPNNDIDENCDGETLIIDNDQDGFNSDEDCNDENAAVNPGALEIPNNDIDENCDGDLGVIDNDQDGFNNDVDCDDENAAINPGAEEIANNDIDENCDGEMLIIDNDQDGFNSDEDCNDEDAAINPEAEEIPNNDIDENCDGEILTSSIAEIELLKINISPNPAKGNARISFSEVISNTEIQIFGLEGKLVKKIASDYPITYLDINVSNFEQGIYIVQIMYEAQIISKKLIVE